MARDLMEFADLTIREEDFKDAPEVPFDVATISDGIPEKWERLLRHNARAQEMWESTKYPSPSEHAYSLMGLSGYLGLTKEEAAAVHVAHYTRLGRKEDGIRKAPYALRAWEKGRQQIEKWEATTGDGKSPEREPGEPVPGEMDPSPESPGQAEAKPRPKTAPLPRLVIPAREFLTRPRKVQPKLIPGLGGRRGGKLGLYGPGGSGKSYTFLNMAMGAALGQDLLQHPAWSVLGPLRSAFVSLEDPASEQLDRNARLLPFYGLSEAPEHFYIFDQDLEEDGFVLAGTRGTLNERAFRRLGQCLGDLKIDLLLIEPKRYLVEVDENSSSENTPWQKRLHELLIRHEVLAIIGHHAGWSRDGAIHARGTTVFRDWVDGMIQQTEDQIQGQPGFLLTCNKSNFAARWNPLSVLFDPETGGMKAVDETTGKLPPALLRVCFEEHGGAIQAPVREVYQTVAQYASCSEATARRGIETAIKDGWLKPLGRGKGFELRPFAPTEEGA